MKHFLRCVGVELDGVRCFSIAFMFVLRTGGKEMSNSLLYTPFPFFTNISSFSRVIFPHTSFYGLFFLFPQIFFCRK